VSRTDQPILSVIIPTRNRVRYLLPSLQALLRCVDTDLEIVVQDNSDNDEVEAAVDKIRDYRLRYQHLKDKLNMEENFAQGFENATGEYVAFIGDDDGINPELISAVRWAKTQGLDAIVGNSAASYFWPDIDFVLYGKKFSATLLIRPFSGALAYPNPEEEMYKCARTAGLGFARLPRAYHGAVRRGLMGLIKERTGTYFPGPTPDMSSSIALANLVKRYAHFDYPLFISGSGRGSGGGAGIEKKHEWTLGSVPWFSRRAIDLWSNVVPRFCSGTTLWAEDVVQALQAFGRHDVLAGYNAICMYARCAVFDRKYFSLTKASFLSYMGSHRRGRAGAITALVYYYARAWQSRFASLASNIAILAGLSKIGRIPAISDIEEATQALSQYLISNGRHCLEQRPSSKNC